MRIKARWLLPLLILLNLFTLAANAQTQPADTFETKVKSALSTYYKNYPQEKIFLHTNQNVYAGGQTLWYKGYATAYGKPSALSEIVYVQLINGSGKLIAQNKLPLKDGLAHGNIDLPDSLHSGWYCLRAFTSWMMNFDDSGYYHQDVYIQNIADTLHQTVKNNAPAQYHVSFFPEGGDLVNGIACNVAFKAVDGAGLPVSIYGDVLDKNGQSVAKLITVRDGMGVFSSEFAADNTYTAVIHFPDKTVQKLLLPAVKKDGIAMQVNTQPLNELEIRVAYTGPPDKYKNVTIVAFQNNGRMVTYPLILGQGINVYSIKKNIFTTGILRLTLFDNAGIPAAERLVFINNHDQLNLQLNADTLSAQPHKKQVFSLVVSDTAGNPLTGNFSVSVTDAAAEINDDDNDNICSYLLASSELRGEIHQPGWYFKNNSDTLQQQLDLVMLTNGWRHFKWEQVLNNAKANLHYPVERSQYIAGKILDYNKLLAEKQQLAIKLFIINQDSSRYIGFVTPDSTGSFILNDYNHHGVSNLFMETSDKKNHVKNLKISLFNTLADSLKNVSLYPFNINNKVIPLVSAYLLSNAISEKQAYFQANRINLSTVTIKERKLSPTEQVINDHVSLAYRAVHEYTLDLVNNPTLDIGIIQYIKGRFPGLRIVGDYFYYGDSNTLQTPGGSGTLRTPGGSSTAKQSMVTGSSEELAKPYFYLNEAPIKFLDLDAINLNDVALIRYMPPPVGFAPYNGGNAGALMIYTKNHKDDLAGIKSNEDFDQYTFNGYTITREFSSPNYSVLKTNYSPDNRTTLYWNHDLNTGGNGKVKFKFYSSDKAKKYHVIIQGIDANGRLGYLNEVISPL